MKIMRPSPGGMKRALAALRTGGVIAHATETCYGLACDMSNAHAVRKLFAMKQREHDKPISALFASAEQAKEYVEWNEEAEKLAAKHFPGPLTLILPLKPTAPTVLFTTLTPLPHVPATVGIRVSSHPLASELAARFGKPLSTTSANLSGEPPSYSPDEILRQFSRAEMQPDLILDSGTLPRNPPSQVIDLTGEKPRTLRKNC